MSIAIQQLVCKDLGCDPSQLKRRFGPDSADCLHRDFVFMQEQHDLMCLTPLIEDSEPPQLRWDPPRSNYFEPFFGMKLEDSV